MKLSVTAPTAPKAEKKTPPIFPAPSFELSLIVRLKFFSLIELLAAVAVMLAILSISTVVLRTKASPAMQLDNAYSSFANFCSRVRTSAAEYAEDRIICYDPEENALVVTAVPAEYVSETNEDTQSTDKLNRQLAQLVWKIPENIEFLIDDLALEEYSAAGEFTSEEEESRSEAEDEDSEENALPGEVIFRVLSDGGVSGKREFTLKSGELSIKLRFSRLTGLLSQVDEEAK